MTCMRGFITGAPAVLGHRLVDCGHEVIGLTRDGEGDDIVERRGGTPKRGNVFEQGSLTARNYFDNPGRVRIT